ncbi:MAG: PEGA domain-containing protein [Polyangiales bacterium]
MQIIRALQLVTCLALAALLGVTRSAHADVAVMVPPRIEQDARADLLEQGIEELTRLLRVQGFDVISAGQAGATAEGEQQRGGFPGNYDPLYCVTPECANEYRRLFDAPFAVQLGLPGARANTVSVVLTEGVHAYFAGSAPIEANDVRAAVRAAFEAAREKQKDGVGPWLSVRGKPEGATVRIDGAEYGKVPLVKRRIEPGARVLEIHAAHHAVERRTLEIPHEIDHVETVDVQLRPLDRLAAHRAESRAQGGSRIYRSPWDYALGGTLATVGVVHLIAGIYQKSVEGDCADRNLLGCGERYGDGGGVSRANMLLGFGALGIAAGATVIVLGPIGRLQIRSGADRAGLELKVEF